MNDIIGMHVGPPLVVHDQSQCDGRPCCIHNPSAHPLRDRPLQWRGRWNGMDRICGHMKPHPDPDDTTYRRYVGLPYRGAHDCDGCCAQCEGCDMLEWFARKVEGIRPTADVVLARLRADHHNDCARRRGDNIDQEER